LAAGPEDLARLLVERVNGGDLGGVVALYEAEAVLALPDGRVAAGHDAIRQFYADLLATKPTFEPGNQLPALRLGDLALTATRLEGGGATAEIARRQRDGSWERTERPLTPVGGSDGGGQPASPRIVSF
jgi:ketosteroid isomerase-like protein